MQNNNCFFKLEIIISILVLIFLISCNSEPTSVPIDLPKYEVYHAKAIKAMETKSTDGIDPLAVNTDLDAAGLNGKVESIRRISYHAWLEDGKIVKGDIVRNANIDSEKRYNELGNETFYTNSRESKLAKQFFYEYFENEKISYEVPIMDEKRILRYRMIFDDSGKNIILHDHKMKLTCFRELDDKGNRLKNFCFKKDSTFFPGASSIYEYEYDYNTDGEKTEKRVFSYQHNDFKRKILFRRSLYRYDENKEFISSQNLTYSIDSVLTVKRIHNQHRDISELSIISDDCKMTPKEKYEYKYDNQDNWIQRVTLIKGNTIGVTEEFYPTEITERAITYYDPSS